MSNQLPIRSAATSFIFVLCMWTCIPPVSALINQGNRPRDDSPATTTQPNLLSRGSSSSNSSIDEVAQDGKGMSPSLTLQRLLHGQPIVRRQANEDFDHCTKDHLGSTFMEPPGCTYSGESFRLCVVGKRKIDRCVTDRSNYCTFCTPGESYMMENNNCTKCIPCTTCDPLTEQVKTDCNIIDDTVCVPKPPDPSCPPCPVTQVVVTSEDTSNLATDSTSQIGSTQPYPTAIETSPVVEPTNCPECKCNCTDVCEKEPDELATCKGCIPLHVIIIVIVVLVLAVIILAARLIWREIKFSKLEAKCDQVAEDLRTEIAKNVHAKENGNYIGAPNRVNASPGSNHRQDQNGNGRGDRIDGNVSQLPLLDESLNPAEESLPQNGKSSPEVVDLPPSGPQSLKSFQPERPLPEVKPMVGHLPGLSSRGGLLLHADVHNGESSSINHPGRHENPGMEMSTLASPTPLAKQEDTLDNTTEPDETDKFIQHQPSTPGNKSVKKDKGGIKGLISKFSPKSPVKKDPAVSVAFSKDGKGLNRNPGSAQLSVTGGGDNGKPPKLHVRLPSDSSPKSPEAPGSLTTPLTKTPAATDKPELGASPTTEGPNSEKTEKGGSVTGTKQGAVPAGNESVLLGDRPSSGADGKANGKRATNGSSSDHHKPYLDVLASEVDFEEVGVTLTPDNLKALYRRLGIKSNTVEQAEVESQSTLFREKAIYILRIWRDKEGKKATRRCLIEALRKCEQGLNADTLEDYFKEHSSV